MSKIKPLHLFAGMGVELEYMIVDRETLDIRPIADEVLREVTGRYQTDFEKEDICWSNELALHVIELKTCGPVTSFFRTASLLQQDVAFINRLLASHRAMLMPTGAHPWMDPFCETRLWPHEQNIIYETFNRIFDCRGHGWSNLQSAHLNLPFSGDEEFGRLHAAIRVLLPLIPALTASTPMVDLTLQKELDHRLAVYRTNSQRIPSITGRVIPEAVFSEQEYRAEIFNRMYQDITPLDPAGILQEEWLNARGAIARFGRSTIEIRILDIQECPLADLASAALIFETLKALVAEKWGSYQEQRQWEVEPLADIFDRIVEQAEGAIIEETAYQALFRVNEGKALTAGQLWRRIFEALKKEGALEPNFCQAIEVMLNRGSLASRIVARLGADHSRPAVEGVYRELCRCLAEGRMLV